MALQYRCVSECVSLLFTRIFFFFFFFFLGRTNRNRLRKVPSPLYTNWWHTHSSFQVVNIIILILYRTGYKGEFLGVGGTWNLNEDKNPDAEIVASGVLVGFFIYTSVVLISYCFGTTYHKRTLVVRSFFTSFQRCLSCDENLLYSAVSIIKQMALALALMEIDFQEIIMNFVGTFMFVAVGGTALHYWHGYQAENKFDTVVQERQVT